MDQNIGTKVHHQMKRTLSLNGISIALVYDLPENLLRTKEHPFPSDAEAEWETIETIEKIAETWRELGCNVQMLPLDKFFLSRWAELHQKFELVHSLVEGWGSTAREAWIPSLCEMSGIPYIGSGPFAQCVSMRKSSLKVLCHALSIPTPEFHLILKPDDLIRIPMSLLERPHFIKPDCEGSGMGIDAGHSIGRTPNQTRDVCAKLLQQFPDGVLIEEFMAGRELTSAFLGTEALSFLPVAEIEVEGGVYGLSNKSKDAMGEKVTFPELPEQVHKTISSSMELLAKHVGFEDFVRFDWKLNDRGIPCLLEANPLAGLSYYYSVLPKMAEASGLKYHELLEKIGLSALSKQHHRRYWYGRSRIHAPLTTSHH